MTVRDPTHPRPPRDVLERLEGAAPSEAREAIFESITNVSADLLEGILLHRAPVPDAASARAIRDHLAELLDVRKADAAKLLATSQSSFSRSDRVDARLLDRAYAISHAFARVAAVLGATAAASWFKAPNPALDNEAPIGLLGTSYGEKRVDDLVEGLLHGAIV